MKSKKTMKWKLDKALMRDFAFLLPVTCLLLTGILGMPWQDAVILSPVVLAAVFLALYTVVMTLHSLFFVSDKVTDRLAIKRSPLA